MAEQEIGFFINATDPIANPRVFKYMTDAAHIAEGNYKTYENLIWNDRIGFITLKEKYGSSGSWWSEDPDLAWAVEKLDPYDDDPRLVVVAPDFVERGDRAVLSNGPCRITSPVTVKWNQPFIVRARLYMPNNISYTDSPIIITWGQNQWRILLYHNPSFPDLVQINANWEFPVSSEEWTTVLETHFIVQADGENTTQSGTANQTISLRIEPKPPLSIAITNQARGGGIGDVYVYDTQTVEDYEALMQWRSTYGFYRDGPVVITLPTAAVAQVRTIEFEESGSYESFDLASTYMIETEPYARANTTNSDMIGGLVVGKTIPGTFAAGGVDDPSMTVTVNTPGGSYPTDRVSYTVDFAASSDGTRTPYFKNISLYHEGEPDEYLGAELNFSDYVLSGSIQMSSDSSERTGEIQVKNGDGAFDAFLFKDSIPVQIQCDGEPVFTGYTSDVSQEEDGPMKKLRFKLRDRWSRLEWTIMMPTRETSCDWYYHNQAILKMLMSHGGFPLSQIDATFDVVEDDGSLPGAVQSGLLIHDYSQQEPSWIPEMGQNLAEFLQGLHDSFGGVFWEMFFDQDGKFYYRPQYDHRGTEGYLNFVEFTSDVSSIGYDYAVPIIGPRTEQLDYSNFRNEIMVVGQWRDPGIFNSDGTINPMMIGKFDQDPLKYFGKPLCVTWSNPKSWDPTLWDPGEDYEYFVSQKRSLAYVNPALTTEEECVRLLEYLVMRFSEPHRTYTFKSLWKKSVLLPVEGEGLLPFDLRPGMWATMYKNGVPITVRIRSMSIDFTRHPDQWLEHWVYLCNYTVEEVKDYEWF